jgi:Flp pilus assembly protein CpaB
VRRFPRALAWRALAVLAAAVTAIVVTGDVRALHAHAHDLGAPRPVVVARHDLLVGARVARRDVEVTTRYSSQVSASAVRDVDAVVGRVVTLSVAAGAPIVARNVAPADAGYGVVIPAGHRIVRVPDTTGLDPAPGSIVDVLASARDGADELGSVVTRGALVVEGDRPAASTRHDAGITTTIRDSDLGVALLVTVDDAPRLAAAVSTDQIVLALAPPADAAR